jgi:hypothetical protein
VAFCACWTRQLLLHCLRLRLVVKLRLFTGLASLLGLSGKVEFLSSLLLRKVLRNGLVIHLLLLRALTKDLLQRSVLGFGSGTSLAGSFAQLARL